MNRNSLSFLCTGLLLTASFAFAQTPAAPLTFEVASIKPSPPPDPAKMMAGGFRAGLSVDGARADIRFMAVRDLVMMAYKIKLPSARRVFRRAD